MSHLANADLTLPASFSPGGRYVLMVSLYDRLGGHVLKWSNLKGQQWGGATLPLQHDGEFFNIEIKVGLLKNNVVCFNPGMYIYLIYQARGPYWENIVPRS